MSRQLRRADAVLKSLLLSATMAAAALAGDEPKQGAAAAESTPPAGDTMQVAVIETTMGSLTVQLLSDVAPKAVENFIGLSKRGYYEGVSFHRIIKDFMIQGGDPTGTGYGGKSMWEIPFEDEFDPAWRFDRKGILAMANTGRPKTNGSQFFITLKPTPWLNDHHTIFGQVIEGIDVVDALGAVETGPGDKPVSDVKVLKVRIESRSAE